MAPFGRTSVQTKNRRPISEGAPPFRPLLAIGWENQLYIALLATLLILLSACNKNSLHIDLTISPNPPRMIKPITFTLHITGANGQPISDAEVAGTVTMRSMDMGKTDLKFTSKGNGDYEASTKEMDMSGEWNLAVDAAQGAAHTKKSFNFAVGD
jgi:hypothetical protein